jgi:small GTP-binding protein
MESSFKFDAFLSYSSKNWREVLSIAEQLKKAGLKIWFDQWMIKPGDDIQVKTDEGLEQSRVLIFCMSKDSMDSDWALLESYTFRFRDPLNKDRRLIPLRLDESAIRPALTPFFYIDWVNLERDKAMYKLVLACEPVLMGEPVADNHPSMVSEEEAGYETKKSHIEHSNSGIIKEYAYTGTDRTEWKHWIIEKAHDDFVSCMTLTPDEKLLITSSADGAIKVWNIENKECINVIKEQDGVRELLLDKKGMLYSACQDGSIGIWELATGKLLRRFKGHKNEVFSLAITPNNKKLISGSKDFRLIVWDLEYGNMDFSLELGDAWVNALACHNDNRFVFAGDEEGDMYKIDILKGYVAKMPSLHRLWVWSLALTNNGNTLISGSGDKTLCIWDVKYIVPVAILEGHTGMVSKICITNKDQWIVSGSLDKTVRIWDINTGQSVTILSGYSESVESVAASADGRIIASGARNGDIEVWKLKDKHEQKIAVKTNNRYTNAKVLLVGESGAGKTGLSKILTQQKWEPTISTMGGWATQLELPVTDDKDIDREIWLWDFGGQADQRLIHQLYMDQTALVVLVFDGQKEDVLETLAQWDRDLGRASRQQLTKILVAARVDVGGLRISRNQIQNFAKEHGYSLFLETSAKENIGCNELRKAIIDGIQWDKIPWHSSPFLFRHLKQEIIRLKDSGRVLMRFKELRETLKLGLTGSLTQFTDEELKAVIGLLAGPCVVWELQFGSWILFQAEYINTYAQAVIHTMRSDKHERGYIDEAKVLGGDLVYFSDKKRLDSDEEKFVLLAMHRTLAERGLCLREQTDEGPVLVFPSYFRRERPDILSHPAVLVSYQFTGFLDEIYATLVVRLHYTKPFRQTALWRYAADFSTLTGKKLGIKMIRKGEGHGELQVYFEATIPIEEKIIFSKYIHEHLLHHDNNAIRLRHYICPYCETLVANREAAMKRLKEGKKDIICIGCEDERRIPLWDEMEQLFASPEITQQVRELEKEADLILDNESKERLLVGEVISTVALAGQICREKNVSDHGIDIEVEFKSDNGQATGKMVYMQLKSGDSYLHKRKSDGVEIFRIDKPRHVEYWKNLPFPVLLVIRKSSGEVLWMDVRHYLQSAVNKTTKAISQIEFRGKRLDVMSVRSWREKELK